MSCFFGWGEANALQDNQRCAEMQRDSATACDCSSHDGGKEGVPVKPVCIQTFQQAEDINLLTGIETPDV